MSRQPEVVGTLNLMKVASFVNISTSKLFKGAYICQRMKKKQIVIFCNKQQMYSRDRKVNVKTSRPHDANKQINIETGKSLVVVVVLVVGVAVVVVVGGLWWK